MNAEPGRVWTEFVAAVGDLVPLPLAGLLLVGAAAVVAAGWYTWPGWLPRRHHWLAVRRLLVHLLRRVRQLFTRLVSAVRRWPGRLRPGRSNNRSVLGGRRLSRWATRTAVRRWWAAARRRLLGLLTVRGPLGRTRHRDRGAATGADRSSPRGLTGDSSLGLADRLADQGRYAEAVRERLRAMIRETAARGLVTDRPDWTITEFSAAAARAAPAARLTLVEAADLFSELWYGGRPALPRHDDRMRELADQLRRALEHPGAAADRSVGATATVAHPPVLDGTRW